MRKRESKPSAGVDRALGTDPDQPATPADSKVAESVPPTDRKPVEKAAPRPTWARVGGRVELNPTTQSYLYDFYIYTVRADGRRFTVKDYQSPIPNRGYRVLVYEVETNGYIAVSVPPETSAEAVYWAMPALLEAHLKKEVERPVTDYITAAQNPIQLRIGKTPAKTSKKTKKEGAKKAA